MKRFVNLLLITTLVGCGPATTAPPASNPVAQQTSTPQSPTPKPVAKKLTSTPSDFSSVDEAIQAMSTAAEANNSDVYLPAQDWLIKKGDASIVPLGQLLADPETGLKTSIVTCRALGQLGPEAAAQLENGFAKDKPQQLRICATEQLGIIKPTNETIVDKLISQMDDDDQRVRLIAIKALGHIGKPAGKVAPKLQSILNSTKDVDPLRGAAKDALTKVNPRKTLVD